MHVRSLVLCMGVLSVIACSSSRKKVVVETAPPAVPVTASAEVGPHPGPQAPVKVEAESKSKVEIKKDIMTCKKDKDVRILEVEAAQPKGCALWYTKENQRKSIANSSHGNEHCQQVREKLNDKLQKGGYECVTAETVSAEPAKSAAKPEEKSPAKPTEKPAAKSGVKPAEKPTAKPEASPDAKATTTPAAAPKK